MMREITIIDIKEEELAQISVMYFFVEACL